MEQMNAEQIIKALECCISGDDCTLCPLLDERSCPCVLNENALALINSQEQRIKEFTAKITKWEEECDLRGDMWCKLNEENKRLAEENEKLRADKDYWKNRAKESDSEYDQAVKRGYEHGTADSARVFAERFALRYGTYTDKDMTPIAEVFRLLDQIAKEMVEGK